MPVGERLYRDDTNDEQGPARLHPVWKWDPDRPKEGRESDPTGSSRTERKSSVTKSRYDSKVGAETIDMDSDSDDGMDIS